MGDASARIHDERRARGFACAKAKTLILPQAIPTPAAHPAIAFDNISASYPVHAMIARPDMEILGANSVEATAFGRHRGDSHVHCYEPLSS